MPRVVVSHTSARALTQGLRCSRPHRVNNASYRASRPQARHQANAAAAAPATATEPRGLPQLLPGASRHHAGSTQQPAHFGDRLMEAARFEERLVFDNSCWETLRSTERYFWHVLSLHRSRVLLGMAKPLAFLAALSSAACLCSVAQQAGLLPAFLPTLGRQLRELFGLTSFALSLVLVFRTNTSYGRWDEARKLWGTVLQRTRDVCRQGLTWIGDDKRELRAMLLRWAPAFSKALMCHLRRGEDLRRELEGLLLPHEVHAVLQAKHRPEYILQVLSQIVHAAQLPDRAVLRMGDSLASLEDSLGGCERLLSTPVPQQYIRHTSRFLSIWLTALPFVLLPACGAAVTVPLTLLISFLLLGIDRIGMTIEEPFSILALEDICGTAAADAHELAAIQHSVRSVAGNAGAWLPHPEDAEIDGVLGSADPCSCGCGDARAASNGIHPSFLQPRADGFPPSPPRRGMLAGGGVA